MRDRAALRAGLLVLALALLSTRGLDVGDSAVHLDVALGIAERGNAALSIDPGEMWVPSQPLAGGLFYQSGGELRSASAPGMAWLALPFVAAGAAASDGPLRLDAFFREGDPRAVIRPLQRDPRVIAFVLFGSVCAGLAAFFVVRAARALGLSPRATNAAICGLVLGSPFLAYAGTTWTQLPAAAALSFVLARLAARESSGRGSAWPIGIACALSILVRPDLLLLVVVAGAVLYRIERGYRRAPTRSMMRFVLPLPIALGAVALHGLPANGGGWSFLRLPEGALGSLLGPRTGLVLYAPFVLFVPLGLARMRARPLAWLVALWLAAVLVVYGGWFDWTASLAYGPRFLVPILPALALAFGAAFEELSPRGRAAAWASIAVGLAVQLPGALLVHARIDEPAGVFAPELVAAWRTLLDGGAIGGLGVDCASTYVPAYALLALAVAVAGMALELGSFRPPA